MNNNYNMHIAYRPASVSAMRFHEPEKVVLLENFFGYRLPGNSVPTINLTDGYVSPISTHVHKIGKYGQVGEYLAIIKSCETGNPVKTNKNSSFKEIDGCTFTYVADVSLNVLKEYLRKTKEYELNNEKQLEILKETMKRYEEEQRTKKEMDELRKENESLKKTLNKIKETLSI